MLNAQEALSIILENVSPLGAITVSLEHCRGFVLAQTVIANADVPPFDNAGMDGYAVRSEDIQSVPMTLKLVGEIAAGAVASKPLQKGEAYRILTGAKIPEGCDAVVQQEWTENVAKDKVTIVRAVQAGHNIRSAGADIKKGSVVLEQGTRLRAQEIGLLASLGKRFVQIVRPPSVAVLATGNELVELGYPVPDGKIRNSNAYVLQALLQEMGCEVKNLGIAKDEPSEIKAKLSEGLNYDAVITSGGVSVGDYDYVLDIMKELGVEIRFWKVNIKPGKPFVFGVRNGTPVFGLPGNPVSTMVTFLQFVKPALLKMMGQKEMVTGFRLQAVLEHEITKKDGKRHFVRGILEHKNGSLVVRTTGPQMSNVLSSLSQANCLIILPEEKETFSEGEYVEVELL